jgi:hypothetical protein
MPTSWICNGMVRCFWSFLVQLCLVWPELLICECYVYICILCWITLGLFGVFYDGLVHKERYLIPNFVWWTELWIIHIWIILQFTHPYSAANFTHPYLLCIRFILFLSALRHFFGGLFFFRDTYTRFKK